jgi:outer membrane protein
MKYIPINLLFILVPTIIGAQQADEWTLERCITHALEQNIVLKIQQNIEQKANYERQQSQWDLVPSLNAWGNSGLDFRRSTNQNNQIASGTAYNMNYGISSSLILFAGFTRLNNISANQFNELACSESTKLATNNLKLMVIDLFAQVLFQKALVEVTREQLNVSLMESKRIEATIETGQLEPVAQTEINATVSGNKLELSRSENQYRLLRLKLAQLIEIPVNSNFEFTSSEFDLIIPVEMKLTTDSVYSSACRSYPAIQQKEYELEYYSKLLKISKGNLAPSLSLNGGYRSGFYSTDTLSDGRQTPVGYQFSNYLNPSLGLSLNIPILNGRNRDFQVRKSRINFENAIFNLENQKKQIRREIEEAILRLKALNQEYKSATDNLVFVEKSFETYREKYRLGLINTTDFMNAQNQLSQARSNLLVTRYSWIVQEKTVELYMGTKQSIY